MRVRGIHRWHASGLPAKESNRIGLVIDPFDRGDDQSSMWAEQNIWFLHLVDLEDVPLWIYTVASPRLYFEHMCAAGDKVVPAPINIVCAEAELDRCVLSSLWGAIYRDVSADRRWNHVEPKCSDVGFENDPPLLDRAEIRLQAEALRVKFHHSIQIFDKQNRSVKSKYHVISPYVAGTN